MPRETYTLAELAEALGRTKAWLYDNWRKEVAAKRLPCPLHGGVPPLVWSRVQVHAVLDASLPPKAQRAAAALRIAEAALAREAPGEIRCDVDIESEMRRLEQVFGVMD